MQAESHAFGIRCGHSDYVVITSAPHYTHGVLSGNRDAPFHIHALALQRQHESHSLIAVLSSKLQLAEPHLPTGRYDGMFDELLVASAAS